MSILFLIKKKFVRILNIKTKKRKDSDTLKTSKLYKKNSKAN